MKKFLFSSITGYNKKMNIAWLVFRVYIGLSMALNAGLPKITARLTAPDWFSKQVGEIGFAFPSPVFWATIASWGEFLGGLLITIGLFTRISAIQLAFQFFVVSFIWYNEPMPIVGMYYQQLLFWGYVLIAVGGAGTISIDQWILRRKSSIITYKAKAAVVIIVGMLFLNSTKAQSLPPVIQPGDLENLRGDWKGSLTYLDYTSAKETVILCNLSAQPKTNAKENNAWVLRFSYPQESGHDHDDEYVIGKEGKTINGLVLLEKTILPNGSLKIVLEEKGEDGNDHKPATFHRILLISTQKFSISKMVRFDGESEFIKRHEYNFSR